MSYHLIYFILLVSSVSLISSRHVPRYAELEEEDQQLYRAAYDTPSYDQHEYEEDDDDMSPGKLDLVKDGLWALKAKIKELKAFDKALAANLLTTKLKLKDLLKNHLAPITTHHHEAKPSYGYQAPSYQAPAYHQYEQPQQYASQPQQYASQPQQYASQPQQYASHPQQYASQPQQYATQSQQYASQPQYGAAAPVVAAFAPAPAVAYAHDPYYGH